MSKTTLWIRTAVILVITIGAVWLVFGPRGSISMSDFSYDGIKKNLAQNINLGLDLKGGSHLVMRVKTEEYLKKLTENDRDAAYLVAKEAKDENGAPKQFPIGEVSSVTDAKTNTYSFTLPVGDPSKLQDVIDEVKKKVDLANPNFAWTESRTDSGVTWTLPLAAQKKLGEQASEQALRIIEGRINQFGVKEPTLQPIGAADSHQILLQMPGVDDPERVKNLIGLESRLELMKVVSSPYPTLQTYASREEALQSLGGKEPPNRKIYPYAERDEDVTATKKDDTKPPSRFVVIETPAIVDGNELREASAVSRTGSNDDYQIAFALKPSGAQKFGDWTGKNINNYMAVVLNDEAKSIAYIKSQIFDRGEISGRFTKSSADDLALTLKSGALPAPIEYQEERTVGPSLGADSIRAGVSASIGGLVFVVLFMLFYYRGAGVNAVIALVLNMLLTIAALIIFDSTLTLPGIAGLILGIGMAVDSNVLIFERIREELRDGKDIPTSVSLGFDRAFLTIIDTHLTTIISSVILWMYGSGPIKGFAVTLILGLLINLFSAVFVSRTIFIWLLQRKRTMQKLSI